MNIQERLKEKIQLTTKILRDLRNSKEHKPVVIDFITFKEKNKVEYITVKTSPK